MSEKEITVPYTTVRNVIGFHVGDAQINGQHISVSREAKTQSTLVNYRGKTYLILLSDLVGAICESVDEEVSDK